ncbi:lipase A [Legionella busanensis]|uniref:Lipase A n=2 Tax=Legionella busanensis TaxID=190655 RepID=A0A378JRW9_9GAMM|nr:alpha/beta hydrolase [Legionella busanensis]STX50882.1 lipase A [Legionella busanensis]
MLSIWEENPKAPISLLFLHGHCTNKTFFSQQINTDIFKNYHRIAIDLPGYGQSPPPLSPLQTYNFPGFAEAIIAALQSLSIEKLVIIGWSLGGHVALEMVDRVPQLIGLLLTGTPPLEVSLQGIQKGFKALDSKIMDCFGKAHLTYDEAQLLASVSGYDARAEKEFLVDAILNTDEDARVLYPQSIIDGIGRNQCNIVANWDKPIAIIGGENDIAINYDYIQQEIKFKKLWRNKIQLIKNAGHAVMLDKPDEFNELLLKFIHDL